MTNAELFKKIFGIYAEEFWAYPKEEMLDWLASDAPDTNDGDLISRQAAIDALKNVLVSEELEYAIPALEKLPPTQSEDWMERNKERILQAGMEGREIEFRIGGRKFAIRELAQ